MTQDDHGLVAQLLAPGEMLRVNDVPGYGSLDVPCVRVRLTAWDGETPAYSFGRKPFISHVGRPLFAELHFMEVLRHGDWDAVWLVHWAGKRHIMRRPMESSKLSLWADPPETIPPHVWDTINRVVAKAKEKPDENGKTGKGTAPDLVAWNKSGEVRFFEVKRRDEDAPNPNQKRFISALRDLGFPATAMTFIEWEM